MVIDRPLRHLGESVPGLRIFAHLLKPTGESAMVTMTEMGGEGFDAPHVVHFHLTWEASGAGTQS